MFSFPIQYKQLLKDNEKQFQLAEDGYTIVPFYDINQLSELNQLFENIQPKSLSGIYPSTFSSDDNYGKLADSEIKSLASSSISNLFHNHKVVVASFIVKYPGNDSYMDVHQDMTLVDESKYSGVNIWCPLQDITFENGILHVLPKSHRILPTYRSASIRPVYDKLIIKRAIAGLSIPITVKAGEAIIFDQSIIHFSDSNRTNIPRIVTNIFITDKKANFQIAYHEPSYGNKVELFEQADDFMINFRQFGENITVRPKIGKSKGMFDYRFPRLNLQYKLS